MWKWLKSIWQRLKGNRNGWIFERKDLVLADVQCDQSPLVAKRVTGTLVLHSELIRFGAPMVEQMFKDGEK